MWYVLASSGPQLGVCEIATLLKVDRNTVGRAIKRPTSMSLLGHPPQARNTHSGTFELINSVPTWFEHARGSSPTTIRASSFLSVTTLWYGTCRTTRVRECSGHHIDPPHKANRDD